MTRQTLNVDLGELKQLVEATAKNQGTKPSAWVREAVALALQEHQAVPVQMPRVAANRSRGSAVVGFGGRLTLAESEALRASAAAEGLSQIEYVAAVAQGMFVPQRQQVVAELGALNTVLQAIEQNLKGLAPHVQDAAVAAKLLSTARLARAQAKRAAEVLDEVSITRRIAGQRLGEGR